MLRSKGSLLFLLLILSLALSACGMVSEAAAQPGTQGPLAATENTEPSLAPTDAQMCSRIAFVLYNNDSGQIYTACPDGSQLTALTQDPSAHNQPAWSPDGTRIAYASNACGRSQIYVMNADGSSAQQITSELTNDQPVWLPDGRSLAFRTTDGKGLWWWRQVDLNGGAVTRLNEPSYDFFYPQPAWSPDGRYEALMSLAEQAARNDGSSQIHIKDLSSGTETALTSDTWANISPVFSPDSTRIAFFSERDGTYDVYALYVMNIDGSGLRRVSQPIYDGSAVASWSPDGTEIIVSSLYDPQALIYVAANGSSRAFLQGTGVTAAAWGK